MNNIIYVDIILIILSYLLIMGRSGKFFLKPSFFFYGLFVQAYLIGIIYTTIYNPYNISMSYDKLVIFNIIPNLYLITFSFGTFVSRIINKFNKSEIEFFNISDYFIEEDRTSVYVVNFIAIVLSLILGAFYFRNGIPLLETNKELSRVAAIRGGGYYFLAITLLIPLFSLIGYYYSKIYKNKYLNKFYILTILTGIVMMIFSLFKSPLARLILILFTFRMLFYKKKVRIDKIVLLMLTLIIIIFTFILVNKRELSTSVDYLIKRLFLINSYDLYHVFTLFPEKIDFLHGKGLLMDIKALAPGPSISFDGWMYSIIYPNYFQGGINSSIGELWAELGWGSLFIGFIWGYILERVFINFIRKPQTISNVLFYSFLVFGLGNTSAGLTSKTFSFVLPLLICKVLFLFGKQIIFYKGKVKYKQMKMMQFESCERS